MYLGIDIGGTKTLLAVLDANGVILEKVRVPTEHDYTQFIKILTENVAKLSTNKFIACGVGVPGRLDRVHGIGLAMGNLPWKNIPIRKDIQKIVGCPVVIENDAKLAGLSESMLLKGTYRRVLYITISTGIGVGFIIDQTIVEALEDSEGGQVLVEEGGKTHFWEDIASGEAIVRRYGKKAKDIHDETTWRHIAHDIGIGMSDLISVIQPEVIVIGGSVGGYFDRFKKPLMEVLHRYELPITKVPPVMSAARPDDAVVYGCYDLAKAVYGKAHS
jgi:predicted NBD/HSP70 family sugar kinase